MALSDAHRSQLTQQARRREWQHEVRLPAGDWHIRGNLDEMRRYFEWIAFDSISEIEVFSFSLSHS